MRFALASLDQKWENKAYNLQRCRELTARARAMGADVVVFPEMTLTGFTMNTELSAEDRATSPSRAAFRDLARAHRITLVAGIVMRTPQRAANTVWAFSPDGAEASYDKMHPFSFSGEDKYFDRGRSLGTVKVGELLLGLTICYDLRFPELYAALANTCEAILTIANWPARRGTHWRTLLQARAIENQVYMIGVNRTGTDGKGLEYSRSSVVFDANGDAVAPSMVDGELDVVDVSRQALMDFRAGFSTRHDRIPEVYRAVI